MTLSYDEARACVLREIRAQLRPPETESIALEAAFGRVLAEDVAADRDFPAVTRSVRDGFAVRAGAAQTLRLIGEVKAGDAFNREVEPGEAVEIMTGAPLPAGADAVVMVEHCTRDGDNVAVPESKSGQYLSRQAEEAQRGGTVLRKGTRLNFPQINLLAATGRAIVNVYAKVNVAIVATGDELCAVDETPLPHQIRNSNAYSVAAQVQRAGGEAQVLGVARDELDATYALVDRGLSSGLLLLSGGVSAGKYDVVEEALKKAGAEFFFDRVAIQPGAPLVFGKARGTFFFGLPGNPGSTMVTFEIFARLALELLSGVEVPDAPLTSAVLASPYRHKPGLTRFLPATVDAQGKLTPVQSHGSGDIPALARANAWMVVDVEREAWAAGDAMPVILL